MIKLNKYSIFCVGVVALSWSVIVLAQPSDAERQRLQEETRADHQQMLQQLGIEKLRPGPSGQADATNAANYDEATANRYPVWPDLLTLNDGATVTNAETW